MNRLLEPHKKKITLKIKSLKHCKSTLLQMNLTVMNLKSTTPLSTKMRLHPVLSSIKNENKSNPTKNARQI